MTLDGENAGIVEVKGRQRIQYQSSAAEDGAKIIHKKEDEPQLAVVTTTAQDKIIVSNIDWNELVPVTARTTILRTQIGPYWYSLQAGKKYMVPRSVRLHLEEKGVV